MSVHVSPLSRPARLRQASGIFFLATFGAVWGFVGTGFVSGVVRVAASVFISLVTLAFFSIGALQIRSARRHTAQFLPEETARNQTIRRWFVVVFGTELVLVVLAGFLLTRLGAARFAAPVIALIVGVHFLPLARLFNARALFLTGGLLVLLALLAMVALLLGIPLAGPSPEHWSFFVSIGAALVLWLTLLSFSRFALRLNLSKWNSSPRAREAVLKNGPCAH